MDITECFLIVGLGNPTTQFECTRHNAGFMIIDAIESLFSFSESSKKFKGRINNGILGQYRIITLKPNTYMNLSGDSVQLAQQYFKVHLNNVIVIHDHMDLALGKIRMKTGGGHGGHNGLKHIDSIIGKEYRRIAVGIGRAEITEDNPYPSVNNFVLGKFASKELIIIKDIAQKISENISLVLSNEDQRLVNIINNKQLKKSDNMNNAQDKILIED